MTEECRQGDGGVTPPEDRTYKDIPVQFTRYRPEGWFVIYENGTVEYKVPGHHIICTMDHFFQTLKISADIDDVIVGIMNTDDETERACLIKHLNHEGIYWETEG